MQHIQRMLVSNRARLFYTLREKFQHLHQALPNSEVSDFPSFDDESVQFWTTSATRHAIEACFLLNFWFRESAYHHRMSQTSLCAGKPWLSCDHTFKSISNIGSVRQADKHWTKQYNGLFCVLNAEGEVVTWKLTKALTFEHVKDKLLGLQQRLQRLGQLEEFFVDTCCSLRAKLQEVFGPQLKLYLDLFHAVQRIMKKIPKRHPYHLECLKALQLVFRDPSDQGDTRTKSTPSPSILRQQLLQFQTVWEGVFCNDQPILPPAAKKEIRCLLVHVDKGCLSGILPGRGTNRNERLHRDLNAHMSSSRYGVELAYALLTSALFTHNEYISAKRDGRTALPITAYSNSHNEDVTELFGLVSSSRRTADCPQLERHRTSTQKVKMTDLQYKQIQEALNDCSLPCETNEDSDTLEMTPEDASTILKQAISLFYVSLAMQKLTKTADFRSRNVFFFSFLAVIQGACSKHQTSEQSAQIDNLLASWNMKRITVPGDGNCLFTSIALGLIQRVQTGDESAIECLHTLGVSDENLQDVNYIQKLLRIRMVEEWNNNQEYYQGFIITDISTLTHEYLESGQFAGCLGDLMVLTLSNVLQTPITVFTSIPNIPLLCIMPTTQTVLTTQPIFLVYTHTGPGHYDCALPTGTDLPSPPEVPTKCTCGRNPKNTQVPCSSWRCPCIRDKKECAGHCRCKGCTNKYGTRPPPSTTRRRQAYDNQRQPLQGTPTSVFIERAGESSNDGQLTLLEVLLLKSIIVYFLIHGLDISPDNILHAYKKIYTISLQCESFEFPIFNRTRACVARFLAKLRCYLDLLKALL